MYYSRSINDRCVKFIGLTSPERERFVESVKRVLSIEARIGKSHPYYNITTVSPESSDSL
jgi:hypothetical protein